MELFCEDLLKRYRSKREELKAPLVNGTIQNMEQYKFSCGRLLGLEEAEVELKTLYKEMLQKDTLNPKDWKTNDEIKSELYRS